MEALVLALLGFGLIALAVLVLSVMAMSGTRGEDPRPEAGDDT